MIYSHETLGICLYHVRLKMSSPHHKGLISRPEDIGKTGTCKKKYTFITSKRHGSFRVIRYSNTLYHSFLDSESAFFA